MGDGWHKALTAARLGRVADDQWPAVQQALKTKCGFCDAAPGLWCVAQGGRGAVLVQDLHKVRKERRGAAKAALRPDKCLMCEEQAHMPGDDMCEACRCQWNAQQAGSSEQVK